MKITRKSPFSGKTHTLEIPVTDFQLQEWQRGVLIQNAMPKVSAEHREFIMTGITPDEWAQIFPEGDE